MITWKLKPDAGRRIAGKHPWIFSNELSQSPKGVKPGEPIRLIDSKEKFVAYGYGNPHSLIAFRALSFKDSDEDAASPEFVIKLIVKSYLYRKYLGLQSSMRLVFGEGDFLPGLVIDRYLLPDHRQVFAVQILSAGMQKIIDLDLKFFENMILALHNIDVNIPDVNGSCVVVRNDVAIRKLEGLSVEEPKVVLKFADKAADKDNFDLLKNCPILFDDKNDSKKIKMNCDLFEGQKTGFFLDQVANIQIVQKLISNFDFLSAPTRTVRILDLCCYVGHWSTRLSSVLKEKNLNIEVTLVDVSDSALQFAKQNASQYAEVVTPMKLDVLKNIDHLPANHYDIVIADPPAFIKAKKDIPTGRHAYLKLNASAASLVKPGGILVSCSCSGLFIEDEFQSTVRKALSRGQSQYRLLAKGNPALDHPISLNFTEGSYLKMMVHQKI